MRYSTARQPQRAMPAFCFRNRPSLMLRATCAERESG